MLVRVWRSVVVRMPRLLPALVLAVVVIGDCRACAEYQQRRKNQKEGFHTRNLLSVGLPLMYRAKALRTLRFGE